MFMPHRSAAEFLRGPGPVTVCLVVEAAFQLRAAEQMSPTAFKPS
jgi:hypothetical protein